MLKNLKILLGISESDTSQDAKLNLILSGTTSRLKALGEGRTLQKISIISLQTWQ